MPGPKALKIELTDAERKHLEKTVRKQTAPQRQARLCHRQNRAGQGVYRRAKRVGAASFYAHPRIMVQPDRAVVCDADQMHAVSG